MGVHSVLRESLAFWRLQRSRSGPNGQPPESSQLDRIPSTSNRGIPNGLWMSESGALVFWKDGVMAKPYSDDLRARAMAIVEGERPMQPGRRAHVSARHRPRAA
ncbi:MAG: hypothetical protein QOH35_1860 [Acidobacteriaceae bacterium]|nr:hypothetical protein [Acidobacteriaceae bacterium]